MSDAPGDYFNANAVVGHRYRVIGYRSDRGFGQIYEAEDTATDQRVALMRLSREFSRPEARERFFDTRSTAAVGDPRIVDLCDYGEDVDGRLFLVMPWLPEATGLDELLAREGLLGWERIKALAEQIAGALEAAAQNGLLHGALEPSRVLLDDQDGVHIVDFGLAPVLSQATRQGITHSGPLPGKIEYLSPEQLRGEPVDGRADVYALGVMLWELVAGAPPFVGDPVEVADAHLSAALPELPRRGPGGKDFAPAELEPLLHLALAKDPGERLATASEFRSLLEAMPGAESPPMLTRAATVELPERRPATSKPAPPAKTKSKPKPPAPTKSKPIRSKPPATATSKPIRSKPPAPAKSKPIRSKQPARVKPPAPAKPPARRAPAEADTSPAAIPQPLGASPAAVPEPVVASPAAVPQPQPGVPQPVSAPQPAAVLAGVPEPLGVLRPPVPETSAPFPYEGPSTGIAPPPRKRRLGKLELAIIAFLAFDLLLFAAWKLLFAEASPDEASLAAVEQDEASAEPKPESAPEPEPELERVQPAAAPQPARVAAEPGTGLSVEEAIAAELPPEPTTPGPVRPMAKTLSDKAFREAMVSARDDMLDRCLDSRMRRTLKVSLKVAPNGEVAYARVLGGLANTSLGQCVVKQVYRIEFPATHEGASHTYTLRLR